MDDGSRGQRGSAGIGNARFDKVADALAEEITKGEEVGAAIAIDIGGETVVDM
jgi:hypothetical protein